MSGLPANKSISCALFRLVLLPLFLFVSQGSLAEKSYSVTFPELLIGNVPASISVFTGVVSPDSSTLHVSVQGKVVPLMIIHGKGELSVMPVGNQPVEMTIGDQSYVSQATAIPLWYSVIPPLVAILFALLFHEVFTALMLGLLSGTAAIAWFGGAGGLEAFGVGLLRIVDTYIVETITNAEHVSIIVFSFLIGGMVHVITKNGGMKGIVNAISRYASTRRSALFSTWLMGMIIFFDDYANTLVVGNTMRPLTDRMRVSREKLSYVIDSTAAPVAAIAFITTWIGAELSYIKNAADVINMTSTVPFSENPYTIFINSLAYAFYPILTLFFVLMIILTGRDYGPMHKAERRSATKPETHDGLTEKGNSAESMELDADPDIRPRAFNALIPVFVVIVGTGLGLFFTGRDEVGWNANLSFGSNLSNIIGNADTFKALLWSSFGGVLVALLLSVSQRLLSLPKAIDSIISGFKTMLTAMMILVLAWSLAELTSNLHTADFLSQSMLLLDISPRWIPAITFVLAALVAFSTGSSWGTMAILYPLILPASWTLFLNEGMLHEHAMMLFHVIVSAVLAGAVFGDHCSPISDTTILSSLATQCNHLDHVRTQLPYALTVGAVSILGGIIPVSFGASPWIAFGVSLVLIFLSIRVFGRQSDQ